jgi:hypothetical protein
LEKGSNGWVILTKGIKNIKMNEGFGKLVYLGVEIRVVDEDRLFIQKSFSQAGALWYPGNL